MWLRSYVGTINVCREEHHSKALSDIATSEVGRVRIVKAAFPKKYNVISTAKPILNYFKYTL